MDWTQVLTMLLLLGGSHIAVHNWSMREIRSDMARHEAAIEKQATRLDQLYGVIIDMLKDRKV